MKQRKRKQKKGSMKLKAGVLKRQTKLTNLQPDSSRKRERAQIKKLEMKKEMLQWILQKLK